jgi:hypothetical protein
VREEIVHIRRQSEPGSQSSRVQENPLLLFLARSLLSAQAQQLFLSLPFFRSLDPTPQGHFSSHGPEGSLSSSFLTISCFLIIGFFDRYLIFDLLFLFKL